MLLMRLLMITVMTMMRLKEDLPNKRHGMIALRAAIFSMEHTVNRKVEDITEEDGKVLKDFFIHEILELREAE